MCVCVCVCVRQTDRQTETASWAGRGRVEAEREAELVWPNRGNRSLERLVEPQECSETAITVSVLG